MTPTEIRQLFLLQTCDKADKLIKSELDKTLNVHPIIRFEKVAHFYSLHITFANEVHQVIKDNINQLSDEQIMYIAKEALETSTPMTDAIQRSLVYNFTDNHLLKHSSLTNLDTVFNLILDSFQDIYHSLNPQSDSNENTADRLCESFMREYKNFTKEQ